jgi:CRP-like cAMP-binding protein
MWFIKGINLLEKIPIEELDNISRNADTITIDRDKYLRPKTETKDKIWLIKSGSLRLIKKIDVTKEVVLTKLEQGELFGFYTQGTDRVIKLLNTHTGVLCYLLQKETISSALKKIPPESIKINININGSIVEIAPDLVSMLYQPITDRTLNVLRILAKHFGVKKSRGTVIKSREIINILSTAALLSNPVVIPSLIVMRKSGTIELYEDKIIIKDESILA